MFVKEKKKEMKKLSNDTSSKKQGKFLRKFMPFGRGQLINDLSK